MYDSDDPDECPAAREKDALRSQFQRHAKPRPAPVATAAAARPKRARYTAAKPSGRVAAQSRKETHHADALPGSSGDIPDDRTDSDKGYDTLNQRDTFEFTDDSPAKHVRLSRSTALEPLVRPAPPQRAPPAASKTPSCVRIPAPKKAAPKKAAPKKRKIVAISGGASTKGKPKPKRRPKSKAKRETEAREAQAKAYFEEGESLFRTDKRKAEKLFDQAAGLYTARTIECLKSMLRLAQCQRSTGSAEDQDILMSLDHVVKHVRGAGSRGVVLESLCLRETLCRDMDLDSDADEDRKLIEELRADIPRT